MDDANASKLTPEEAFNRYAKAIELRDQKLEALYDELKAERDIIRVLFLVYLDLGRPVLVERTTTEARDQAQQRGLIAGSYPVLTSKGLEVLWDWKNRIAPHLRDPFLQGLWREVMGW